MKIDLNELNGKKIFITGGTGFIGKNLIKFLIDSKITPKSVTVLSRDPNKFIENYPELVVDWLLFEQSDIRNLDWNNQEYDYFIHAATSVVNQANSSILFDEIIDGTKCALAFAKSAKVKSFINMSSGAVYKAKQQLDGLLEQDELVSQLDNEKNTYGLAKITSEHLTYLASQNTNLKASSLRCFCFCGPYLDTGHFAIGEFIQKAILDENILVKAGSGIYRSYMIASDLAKQIFEILILSSIRNSRYEVYNIGSSEAISLPDLANKVIQVLESKSEVITPNLSNADVNYYVPNVDKVTGLLNEPLISLENIILETANFYRNQSYTPNIKSIKSTDLANTEAKILSIRKSVSAIVACYNDELAIPIMADRLVTVFTKCGLDYEIIFVSNGSTDKSLAVIQGLSLINNRIIGVSHSRSYEQTSQASFLNGMELSTKEACVLLDGDLQDPPELIEEFVTKWQDGYDIVYGIRYKREAPLFVRLGSKVFYRIFNKLSAIPMPHDASDFSLIDRRAVDWIIATQEHDVFIRGIRAYVGFKQTGIKYFRPERMFGKSSNNFFKLTMWLKKGIFSYSRKPLDWMTTAGFSLVVISIIFAFVQIIIRIFYPSLTPHGLSTVILLIMFFGSFTILSISIIGEYIAKIVEETKRRPIFIRDKIIKNGIIRNVFHKDHSLSKKL